MGEGEVIEPSMYHNPFPENSLWLDDNGTGIPYPDLWIPDDWVREVVDVDPSNAQATGNTIADAVVAQQYTVH